MGRFSNGRALYGWGGLFVASCSVLLQHEQKKRVKAEGQSGVEKAEEVTRMSTCHPLKGSKDLIECIGNTPLIRLHKLSEMTGCEILAKAEFMNPGGSIKDRTAKYMILEGEKQGLLKKDDAIVEATGGNTGIALAMLAASRGYRTIFSMPDSIATEKIELMRTLGAEVHVQPLVSYDDKEHFYQVAKTIGTTQERVFYPDQFENLANFRAHYMGTGPEIFEQTGGRLDSFVCSSGTGGTIAGCSTYLKQKNKNIQIYLIDPEGGATARYVASGRTNATKDKNGVEFLLDCAPGKTIAEGVGINRVTENFRHSVIDGTLIANDQELLNMAYFLMLKEGVFVGPSAALNVVGAFKVARKLGPGHTIVTVLCDGGDRYRSKIYNQAWLKEQKLHVDISEGPMSFIQ